MKISGVALVTGGGTGIGAAAAEMLAAAGATVAIHYHRSREAAESVAAGIGAAGGTAQVFAADLADRSAADRLVNEVVQGFGGVHILINNAGSLVGRKTLPEIGDDFWDEVIEVNLGSVMRLIRGAVPHMIAAGGGAIVNVGSVAARSGGSSGVLAYATAKAGVIGMTKALARELIPYNIRVNAVNPGVIDTPLHARFTSSERLAQLIAAVPQKRCGTPAEVASVIAFLASTGASYVVGETIEVNGGLWMD